MSEPKTTSELVDKYAGILDTIVRLKTQGSYTYHGVLGSFLNEWLEMHSSEEEDDDHEPQTPEGIESLTEDDLEIMRAFNKQREGRRSD